MKRAQYGAALWIGCLQYFLAEFTAVLAWPGSYSFRENYISDLGAAVCHASGDALIAAPVCSPLHALMNASFVLQGILIVGGVSLTFPLFPAGRLWRFALYLIAASGAGVFVVGLASEDAWPTPHFIGAVENFICCNLGMAALGVAMLRWNSAARSIGVITFCAGALGIFGFACLAAGFYFGLGVGGMERVAAYPFPIWLVGMGVLILVRRRVVADSTNAPTE
jgi:hypothetical membrane protein